MLVDDDDRLRERRASRAPTARASPSARGRETPCGSRRSRSCGTRRRRAGRSRRSRAASCGRREEDPLRRLAEPGVLRRRLPDDDRRVDRVAPHRHRREPEDRERLGVRVVARVVAERPLDADVVLRDVSLEDDLGVRRAPRGRSSCSATSSTGSPRRNPASMSSSRCFGSGALAEYAVTGSSPIATATGMRPSSAASRSARPSLCSCQCMKVERAVDHLHAVHADVAATRVAGPS